MSTGRNPGLNSNPNLNLNPSPNLLRFYLSQMMVMWVRRQRLKSK